jgi:hypothetical protein
LIHKVVVKASRLVNPASLPQAVFTGFVVAVRWVVIPHLTVELNQNQGARTISWGS